MNATKTNQECEQSRILEHVHVAGSILKDDDEANKGAMTNQDTDAAREDPLRVGRAPDLDLGGDVAPEEHLVAAAFGLGAAAGPAGEGQIEELRSPPSAISAASAPSAVLVTAKMFHVRLRDSWGNAVPFELFHVPFKSLGDDMRHLVGLREHGDYQDGRRGPAGSCAVCAAPGEAPAELHEAAPAIATPDEDATSVRSSESEDSLSSIGSASSVVGKDDAHMQIDVVVCDALPTKYLSRNFMDEFGQHKCFAECIFEPTRFVDWLMATADAVCGGSQLPQVRTFGELCIRGGSHAQVIERMAPALLLPSGGCEDGARSAVAGSLKVLAL
mmetsp:Transcript_171644/g.550182  ORF Transcript_171644/g.550182 Transcript_171644/m.550182 type:complete len:330 (+) Transcript_171644:251-1240(+)